MTHCSRLQSAQRNSLNSSDILVNSITARIVQLDAAIAANASIKCAGIERRTGEDINVHTSPHVCALSDVHLELVVQVLDKVEI